MTESVVEETRTQVTTKEVTETRYQCCVCDMVYEEDQVINIGLDRYETGESMLSTGGAEPRAERVVCQHCASGLFDYDAGEQGAFAEPNTPVGVDWATLTGAFGALVFLVGVPLIAVAGVVGAATGTGTISLIAAFGFALGVAVGALML